MKCREAIKLMTYRLDGETARQFAIKEHALSCQKCRREIATNQAIKFILDQYSLSSGEFDNEIGTENDVWQETRLINQVRARIQSAKESGLGTWESAIVSVRGWLFAFAAAAIFLLALSGQLAVNKPSVATPQIEDLISSNTQVNSSREFNNEEAENVR